jgi:hypothetical protein
MPPYKSSKRKLYCSACCNRRFFKRTFLAATASVPVRTVRRGGREDRADFKHRARLSPRLIPGRSQFVALSFPDLERSGAMALTLSPFQHFVIHAEGSLLRTDDRDIPGYGLDQRIWAELTPEQRHNNGFGGNPFGTAPNTMVTPTGGIPTGLPREGKHVALGTL